MKGDALFLIYGRINDEFVAMARSLREDEVTERARQIRERTGNEVLILEDEGGISKRKPAVTGSASKRAEARAMESLKDKRIVSRGK